MNLKPKHLFAGIFLIAIFFRFFLIGEMPGGLFPDEAANGLDINLMQQGQLQPFYERGNGREALFFYMLWTSVEMFGKGPWQHHVVSATVGVLAVLLTYFFTYQLFLLGEGDEARRKKRARTIALLAMFFMAVSAWHVVLSRTAFRANLIPLFTTATLLFMLKSFQSAGHRAKLWFAMLAGSTFALGFYTYIAYRIMVPILGAVLIWPLLAQLPEGKFVKTIKKYFLQAAVFSVAFVVFAYPLFKYFYTHPGTFIGRSGQVSVFNQELYTINGQQLSVEPSLATVASVMAEVGKQSILGFVTAGDVNWRHNISGMPMLSVLLSPFFVGGLLVVSILGIWYACSPRKRYQYWKYFLLTVWFWGMLLPVVTTAEGIPHGLRSIGLIPAIFVITALAVYKFATWGYALHRKIWERCFCYHTHGAIAHPDRHSKYFAPIRLHIIEKLFKVLVVVFMLSLVLQSYVAYFVYAYNSPDNFYAFRSDLTIVSGYLKQRCDKERTYLVLDKFSVQTTDYLTSDWHGNFTDKCNVPYIQVDPERAWQLPKLKPGDEVVFTQSSMFDTKKFKAHHPESFLQKEVRNKFKQAVLAVYKAR